MNIHHLFASGKPAISFEFFPPRTEEGVHALMETIASLRTLSPAFVSITYGAGGTTRRKTVNWVSHVRNQIGLETVAHLACLGHTAEELSNILDELAAAGVGTILALRGDPPKDPAAGGGPPVVSGGETGFRYAVDLVRFIKARYAFSVGVAGYPETHPEAPSFEADLERLVAKVRAGAAFVVTQLFFDAAHYIRFVTAARKAGVTVPIIPGVMPITDLDQIRRFTSLCGATIPDPLVRRLEAAGADREAVARIGVEHATEQCRELLSAGAPGIHFYTLNKSRSTREIFERLKAQGVVP